MNIASRLDVDAIAGALTDHAKAIVARELATILHRITQIEAREPIHGKDGKDGANGKDGADADLSRILSLEAEIVNLKLVVAELRSREPLRGEKGDSGRDGKDGVDGKPGETGAPGRDGVDGKDGNPGRDGERGATGADGAPGRDGRDGLPGTVGKDGLNGKDGRDGIDGKDGAAGLDGKDGFGLDEYTEHLEDGGRILVRKFTSGDRVKEFRHVTAQPVYRGVFIDGSTYEPGDCATYGGGIWHCNEETIKAPTETGKSWTLAVKQGRYGKDGKNGKDGERGPPGRDGRNAY